MKRMFDCDIIGSNKKCRKYGKCGIRKADIGFLLIILVSALVILFIMRLHRQTGNYADVLYGNGIPLARISLEQPMPRYFLFTYTESGSVRMEEFSEEEWTEVSEERLYAAQEYNVFMYKDNEIRMLLSSCPDKICVNHRAISMTGENIICLPHKLVIEISGDEETAIDGVAY